jgi:hypothetical protein
MLYWKAALIAVLGFSASAFALPQSPKGGGMPKGGGPGGLPKGGGMPGGGLPKVNL